MRSLLLLCALAFTACTTTSAKIEGVDALTPGVSTIADAREIMGPPKAKGKSSEGMQIYQWEKHRTTTRGQVQSIRPVNFTLTFDEQGKFVRSEIVREPWTTRN